VKKSITGLIIVFMLFLDSCARVVSVPTVTPTRKPEASPTQTQPPPWPGLHAGWMNFKGTSRFYNPVYDPQGYLWAVTFNNDIYRWDLETGELKIFTSTNGLPGNLYDLKVFDNKVWVSAGNGKITCFLNGEWVTQTVTSGDVSDLSSTGDRLWVGANDGMYYLEGKDWKRFDLTSVSNQIPPDNNYRVARSKDGSLWFWKYDRVFRFDGIKWQEYQNLQGVNDVITLSDGTLLFLFSDLIMVFDGKLLAPMVLPGNQYRYYIRSSLLTPEKDLWLQISSQDGYASNDSPTYLIHNGKVKKIPDVIFEDFPEQINRTPQAMTPQGWVFYGSNDIYLYQDNNWKKLGTNQSSGINQMIGNNVIGFSQNGSLWTLDGENNVPIRFDGEQIESVFEENPDIGYCSKWMIDPKGTIWGRTPGGNFLCMYNPNTKKSSTIRLFFDIKDFAVSPDGALWLASGGGFIAKLTDGYIRSADFIDIKMIKIGEGLVNYHLEPSRIVTDRDGAVWVFVDLIGLYRYNETGWKFYGLSDLMDSNNFAIGTNGRVWAGFPGELVEFDGDKWNAYSSNCVNPSDLVVAPDDAIWFINGCDGVYRFDGKVWTHFAKDKELGGIIPYEIQVAPDGALWFFSNDGWARYKQ